MFVKPTEGMKVRDPRTLQLIPETGINVPDNDFYWIQRLQQGDVEKAIEPAPGASPPDEHSEAAPPHSIVTGETHASAPSEEKPQ